MIDLIRKITASRPTVRPKSASLYEIQEGRDTTIEETKKELNELVRRGELFFYLSINKITYFYLKEEDLTQ